MNVWYAVKLKDDATMKKIKNVNEPAPMSNMPCGHSKYHDNHSSGPLQFPGTHLHLDPSYLGMMCIHTKLCNWKE